MNSALRIALKILILSFFIFWMLPSTFIILTAYALSFFSASLGNTLGSFASFSLWSILDLIFRLSIKIEIVSSSCSKDNAGNSAMVENTQVIANRDSLAECNTERSGGVVPPKGSFLVIANHISAIDFMLVNSINKHMLAHTKMTSKQSLMYLVPLFYFWAKATGQLILSRDYSRDKERIVSFVSKLVENMFPAWIVLFCEGTRFTPEKKLLSDEFCKKTGIAPFRNVLCPRYRGFTRLFESLLGSYITKLLDFTFYCEDPSLTLAAVLFTGRTFTVLCDIRTVDLEEIEDSREFLFDAFRRKDGLIDSWRLTSKKSL